MSEVWGSGGSQRRSHHQKPPNGSKGQRPHPEKSRVIYRYRCERVECDEEYIGESARTFADRFNEPLKASSQYMIIQRDQVMMSTLTTLAK